MPFRASLALICATFSLIAFPPSAIAAGSDVPTCFQQSCLGFHIGSTFSRITHASSMELKPGLHLGVEVEVPLSELLALTEEMNYTQRGGREFVDLVDSGVRNRGSSVRIDELELPVQLKVRHRMGSTLPYVKAGPSIAAIAGSSISDGTALLATEETFSNFELSFRFGAGASFAPFEGSPLSLDVGLQYVLGIRSILKSSPIQSYNRTTLLTIAAQFPF